MYREGVLLEPSSWRVGGLTYTQSNFILTLGESEFILKDQQTIETEGMRGQLSTKQGNNIGVHIPDVSFPRKAELKVLNGVSGYTSSST